MTEGGFVATYKYALLHAIADLCVENDPNAEDGSLTLTVDQIAGKFIELYWRQTQHFPARTVRGDLVLKQNAGKQAAVINTLRELHRPYQSRLPSLKDDPRAWRTAIRQVGRTVKVMPLWKLQTIGTRPVEFLYRNEPGADRIVLFPGVALCFRAFYGLIIELVRGGRVRFIRRHNDAVRESLELYTFLFGSDRANLDAYLTVLADIEGTRCFYCERTIGGRPHVDHFIPWARYPNDLGHNFVLAHDRCNGSKSDYLAAEEHLEHWAERNASLGQQLSDAYHASRLDHDADASVWIARWAYGQLDSASGDVWVKDKEFRPLSPNWVGLLAAVALTRPHWSYHFLC